MARSDRIDEIKRLYPLLYFACHRSHGRSDGLTERDLRILHHVQEGGEAFASGLMRHLGLSRSTLSAALASLESRGLIQRQNGNDRRKFIRLTASGARAIQSDEGLDGKAIGNILDNLEEDDQKRVIDGFKLIAQAIERRKR